ncbi:hypothetical protein SCG7109_AE_00300 [Chlamydiales bacterium SCGC AG-110-M15]|nr:hypothetical protein SCG7109_AE_00300 [Chlamydiales bacterium SCGC AG-110-M15]
MKTAQGIALAMDKLFEEADCCFTEDLTAAM